MLFLLQLVCRGQIPVFHLCPFPALCPSLSDCSSLHASHLLVHSRPYVLLFPIAHLFMHLICLSIPGLMSFFFRLLISSCISSACPFPALCPSLSDCSSLHASHLLVHSRPYVLLFPIAHLFMHLICLSIPGLMSVSFRLLISPCACVSRS